MFLPYPGQVADLGRAASAPAGGGLDGNGRCRYAVTTRHTATRRYDGRPGHHSRFPDA
ncbi:hypothetical protein FsymDg_3376 [Candidatus Protofrankia datiscae]|uniref:Uncharacterized protein n=1 Tax=Candidatus Protofrankia datiscae TaxID=2716812 RepID=F8B0P3_9ACTN|nr:hypothetical protein FsymDg_3376 [Candidatus Protofrankia datiscae]